MSTDPRTVDRDGFVVGSVRAVRAHGTRFGTRPSVGGVSATVQRGTDVGVIVGLTSAPGGGLMLTVVWLDPSEVQCGLPVSDQARTSAIRRAEYGEAEIEAVPAAGLVALDADVSEPI